MSEDDPMCTGTLKDRVISTLIFILWISSTIVCWGLGLYGVVLYENIIGYIFVGIATFSSCVLYDEYVSGW